MPNAVITIPQPVLTSGQYFKTRYRLMPAGSWSSYVNRTNAAFTLTGLSAAQYQLEVILVKADGTNCPPVYKTFTLITDYQCTDFTIQLVATGGPYIQIAYSTSVPMPPCGWIVTYKQGTAATKSVSYPSGFTSNPQRIYVPTATVPTLITVTANLCNGRTKDCYSTTLPPVAQPCDAMALTNAIIQETFPGSGIFNLSVFFVQSTPPSTSVSITYKQTGTPLPSGCLLDIMSTPFTIPISPTATFVTFPIHPKACVSEFKYMYDVWLIDGCGNPHLVKPSLNYG